VLNGPDGTTVPGHGPLGDRAALMKYREMLVTVRERLQTLKTAGRSAQDVVAAKPLADLDAVWGKGFLMPDQFVQIAFSSLSQAGCGRQYAGVLCLLLTPSVRSSGRRPTSRQ
jgi:hypothetical protein